jgi:hypothetical protein
MEATKMVTIAQLLGIFFGLVMMIYTIWQYSVKKVRFSPFVFWLLVWSVFVLGILLFDEISLFALSVLDVEGFDLLLYLAVLFIFILIVNIYSTLQSLKKNISEIVETIARNQK